MNKQLVNQFAQNTNFTTQLLYFNPIYQLFSRQSLAKS